MLLHIYLLIIGMAFFFFILANFKKDFLAFTWIATLLFFVCGVSSFSIQVPFCEYDSTNSMWQCHIETFNDVGVAYLFFGLGVLSLVHSIIISIWEPVEELGKQKV